MYATLLLINKYFWRGYIGPIFAFVIPLVLTLFIGRIVGAENIIPGAFLIPTLCVLLVFMPQTIFEFKNSSILKRIGSTPIKPYKFLLAIAIFNFIIVLVGFAFLFAFSFAIFSDGLNGTVKYIDGSGLYVPDFLYMIQHANWWSFFYASIVMMIMSITIGLFIASIGKSTLFIQSFGISLLLIIFFVGPVVLPISMVADVDVVKYIGYIIPLKYPVSLCIEAFTSGLKGSIINIEGSSIWDIYSDYQVLSLFSLVGTNPSAPQISTVYNEADKALNLAMPYIFILIFTYLTGVTFGWSNRGKTNFNWGVVQKTIKQAQINKAYAKSHPQSEAHLKNKIDEEKNILEIHNISKTFHIKGGDVPANQNVSFNIERNKNLALIGANGAGKTTLIEMVIGINRPDQGEFKYNFSYLKSFKEKIGIQFQDSNYPFGIRAKDIIWYFLKAYNIKMGDEELKSLVKQFGVSEFYNKNCSGLSGGQQQRLNLLLSILHKPKLLFLDELSTGLDIKIRTNIKTFIKKYAEDNGITIVIISHDMDEVAYLCKDVITMKDGKVMDVTTVDRILHKHASLESYIDEYL